MDLWSEKQEDLGKMVAIDEIRMIPNVVKHPNRNSPPKLGGVAARSIKSREAILFRADGVVLGLGTTPSRLMKRRRATPPNLGGEFLFGVRLAPSIYE